jgi:hypothetical protein
VRKIEVQRYPEKNYKKYDYRMERGDFATWNQKRQKYKAFSSQRTQSA